MSSEVRQMTKHMTECSICFDHFNDPRILPCIHTFCINCMFKTGSETGKKPGDDMPCPICNKMFTIPKNSFTGLQKNFFMERLIETTKKLEGPSSKLFCDACADNGCQQQPDHCLLYTSVYRRQWPDAAMRCFDCEMNLCEKCCQHHQRSKLTQKHKMGNATGETGTDKTNIPRRILCQLHVDEEMKIYCSQCKLLTCPLCFLENHKGHSWIYKTQAAEEFRKQLHTKVNDLKICVEATNKKLQSIEEKKEKAQSRSAELEKQILRRRDYLIDLIHRHSQSLISELSSKQHSKIKEITLEHDDTERHLVSLESYRNYCSSILEKGTDDEICRMEKVLLSRGSELKNENDSMMKRQMTSNGVDVTFAKFETPYIAANGNLIGSFKEKSADKSELTNAKSDGKMGIPTAESRKKVCEFLQPAKYIGKMTIKRSNEKQQPIVGVGFLNDELFVITGLSSVIEIHDAKLFTYKRKWSIEGLQNPQDIAACKLNRCLYVIDWSQNKIFRLDPNGTMIYEWSGTEIVGRLSITSEGNVLLTSNNYNRLIEYDKTGNTLTTVELVDIKTPQHAVELSSGHFMVCYGENCLPSGVGIAIVDKYGNTLKTYENTKGSGAQVRKPLHMTVSDKGYILVVEWRMQKIIVLNSNLQYQRTLITKEQYKDLHHPARLCLDEDNRRLFVADNYHGSDNKRQGDIVIFSIQE